MLARSLKQNLHNGMSYHSLKRGVFMETETTLVCFVNICKWNTNGMCTLEFTEITLRDGVAVCDCFVPEVSYCGVAEAIN